MTLRPTPAATFEALPNPRGGQVPSAHAALAEAQLAFAGHGDMAVPLRHAARALREAGWLASARYVELLMLVSPWAIPDGASRASHGTHAGDAATADANAPGAVRQLLGDALDDLRIALDRHNLRELSCSPALFARERALCDVLAPHTPGFTLHFEDIALAGRPVPPATLRVQPAQRLALVRARYEAALLPALRSDTNGSRAAAAWAEASLGELDACLVELTSDDPYDFWRLASACGRALRRSAPSWGDAEMKRFYARCNLVLADHAHGIRHVPHSLVRTTLALLWRDYALFGAAAEDTDDVDLLHDYGLTVDWHVAGTQASEALWEEGAAQAGLVASHVAPMRELGALAVNANAYEDFLQTADASMTTLGAQADAPAAPEPGEALLAADAAYRLGASAWALGLGHVGLLADALGLAWRRTAHALAVPAAARAATATDQPGRAALVQATESLRAMLHKTAAGVAQPDASTALKALGAALGSQPGH